MKHNWNDFFSEVMVIHGPDVARTCKELHAEQKQVQPEELLRLVLRKLNLDYSGPIIFNYAGE